MGHSPEHNHLGEPTYAAYALGCRHHDCLAAFSEYKVKLAERKLSGDFRDMRLRMNRIEVIQLKPESVTDEPIPATGEPEAAPAGLPELPAGADDAESAENVTDDSVASEDKDKVLKFLSMSVLDLRTQRINPQMVGVMPGVLQMTPERIQAAVADLVADGTVSSDGNNLYLTLRAA